MIVSITWPGLEGEKCNTLLLGLNGQTKSRYFVLHSCYCMHDFSYFHLFGLVLQYFQITFTTVKVSNKFNVDII